MFLCSSFRTPLGPQRRQSNELRFQYPGSHRKKGLEDLLQMCWLTQSTALVSDWDWFGHRCPDLLPRNLPLHPLPTLGSYLWKRTNILTRVILNKTESRLEKRQKFYLFTIKLPFSLLFSPSQRKGLQTVYILKVPREMAGDFDQEVNPRLENAPYLRRGDSRGDWGRWARGCDHWMSPQRPHELRTCPAHLGVGSGGWWGRIRILMGRLTASSSYL